MEGPDKIKPESSRLLSVQDGKLLATLCLSLAVNWSLGSIVFLHSLAEAGKALRRGSHSRKQISWEWSRDGRLRIILSIL